MNQVMTFIVGSRVSFIYDGKIRVGEVREVRANTVLLHDYLRDDYRSFKFSKINVK